ncbi:MAG: hypothetical protein HN413_06525 [Chloroflexi bacterium]|jgi:predicted deacylase|nr:hypothetical protein [Chloroflexota bacterium]
MQKRRNDKNRSLRVIVSSIWGLVLILFVGLGAAIWWQNGTNAVLSQQPMQLSSTQNNVEITPVVASVTLEPSPTPVPSDTVVPSPTPLPSSTPQPSATLNFPTRTRNPSATPRTTLPTVIGHSVNGRPLEIFAFGSGSREHLIIAGIHGGYEWNTVALADELIAYIGQHPEIIPADMRLYILRAFNPDGEARSHNVDGRANANGVDLNRNFPALWQAEWSRNGCWDYGPISAGPRAASEPETTALMDFMLTHRIEALISYHSAALGIFAGGQPPDSDSIRLAESLAAVSNYPYPPIDTSCTFTGQLIDWASNAGIPAVDIELTNHRDTDFEQNFRILEAFLEWEQ